MKSDNKKSGLRLHGSEDGPKLVRPQKEILKHRRILAIVNPVSGIYPYERTVRDLEKRAEKLGVKLDVILTQKDLDGDAAVQTRTQDYDCYLAVGGDGTVMEVATAAIRDGVPLAILPRGTANAMAWHFRLPIDEGQALKVASRGRPIEIDVADSPQREFLIMAGLGWDAHIIEAATRKLKRRFGFLAYLFAALKQLRRKPYVFNVYLDDGDPVRVSGTAAVVTNTGTLAGNLRLVSRVSPTDGLLDVVVVSPESFITFFRMVILGIFGRLQKDPRVKYFQAKKVRIQCRPGAPLEIDGDVMGKHREFQASVRPKALTLMTLSEGMSWFPLPDWNPTEALKELLPDGITPGEEKEEKTESTQG